MTDYSNKRNANCLFEDGAAALEMLSNILDEHIKTSNERMERFEEALLALTQKVDDCSKMNTFGEGHNQNDDEDISDDEESVVDKRDQWIIMFRLLRDYRITNGHCKITQNENSKLYYWIKNQKTFYNNAKTGKAGSQYTRLSNEKIAMLESIGFSWGKKYPLPVSWDEMFEKLQNYQQRLGNCNVPFNAINPTPLAAWVACQRKEYKRFKIGKSSLITLDQIGMLKDIGLSWKSPKL
jgi:hypothetical protein